MKFTVEFLVLVCLATAFGEEQTRYDDYKVYQITPTTEDEASLLGKLRDNPDFDFWSAPRALNVPSTVMVSPTSQAYFENYLRENNMEYSILIDNVESTVQEETFRQLISPRVARGSVSFTQFLRHSEINDYLRTLASSYPSIVKIEVVGRSYQNREILAARISSGGTGKPTILVDAGIHAREWIAPPVALYIIQQLVENSANAALYRNVDWVVIPSLNPDGYEFSHTNTRLWRKTRSPGSSCYGVDPNRNFDFYWMVTGASNSQCSEIYAGPAPFSEPETAALRDYLRAHRSTIKLYLTFHSYGQYLLYPWGYTSALPPDNAELNSLGQEVNAAIRAVAGTTYTIGTSTNVLYAAAGGSDDYVKGVTGVQLSYTIELPGGGTNGFNPPASRILPIVQETWEGIKVYQRYIERKFV